VSPNCGFQFIKRNRPPIPFTQDEKADLSGSRRLNLLRSTDGREVARLRGRSVSPHCFPGAAPQVGQPTESTCLGLNSFFIRYAEDLEQIRTRASVALGRNSISPLISKGRGSRQCCQCCPPLKVFRYIILISTDKKKLGMNSFRDPFPALKRSQG